jgi:hypothetical protein
MKFQVKRLEVIKNPVFSKEDNEIMKNFMMKDFHVWSFLFFIAKRISFIEKTH